MFPGEQSGGRISRRVSRGIAQKHREPIRHGRSLECQVKRHASGARYTTATIGCEKTAAASGAALYSAALLPALIMPQCTVEALTSRRCNATASVIHSNSWYRIRLRLFGGPVCLPVCSRATSSHCDSNGLDHVRVRVSLNSRLRPRQK